MRTNQVGAARAASKAHVEFAHVLADIAGRAVLPYFRRPLAVENKSAHAGFDPVTAADRAAERAIREAVQARFPEHGVVGEEYGTIAGKGPYRWLIDPIDGTRAFITGSPLWGTLIGLLEGPRPVLGLMSQPFTGERFWSDGRHARWRGPGARARRLATRPCGRLDEAILTTTHPDLFSPGPEREAFEALKARARMTRFGGDCYGYCLLAAGFVDLVVEAGLKPHDVAALIPIIEGAGGRVSTWDGKSAVDGGRVVAAGDPRVHEQALAVLAG